MFAGLERDKSVHGMCWRYQPRYSSSGYGRRSARGVRCALVRKLRLKDVSLFRIENITLPEWDVFLYIMLNAVISSGVGILLWGVCVTYTSSPVC